MKKLILLLLSIIILSANAFAQICQWAERIAGNSFDYANCTVTDASGNVYVLGQFSSDTINLNNGKALSNNGSSDVYIAKYNGSGICLWAEKIAGTDYDAAKSISIDKSGNIFVAGSFESNTLTFNNGKTLTKSGASNPFFAKYDSSGLCQLAIKISGTSFDYAECIAVDGSGNMLVAGYFSSNTLILNNGKTLTKIGSTDAFIAKYDSTGLCIWAEKIAGTNNDYAKGIDYDGSGNIYAVGYFQSSSLNFNAGKSLTNSGSNDAFVAKYDSSGVCLWAEKISGTNSDYAKSITVDESGNINVAGDFVSNTLTLNNGKSLTNTGNGDAFIAKYNNNGVCQWVEKIGGTGVDFMNFITNDAFNNLYVAGTYGSSSLYFNNGKTLTNIAIARDGYVAKYNSSGICQWAERITGTPTYHEEYANGVSIDVGGNVFAVGYFGSDTLIINNGKTLKNILGTDAFVVKYGFAPTVTTSNIINISKNSANCGGNIIAEGSSAIIARGICWSTNENPTISDNKTNDSTGIGAYSSSMTGLIPNTNYYVRAYAINDIGVAYGDQRNFKTSPTVPTLMTTEITNIGATSAISGGDITSDGGANVTSRGVCWSTNQNPTTSDNKTIDGSGIGSFASSIDELNTNTTYYVRAYAINNEGTAYGNELEFKTLDIEEFNVPLSTSWNLISSYIQPQEPDSINLVLTDIESNLLIAKNNSGQVYIPSFSINTIGRWIVTQSYLLYMTKSDTLTLKGKSVNPVNTPIQLNNGWNTISYLRNSELSAEISFTSITDNSNLLIAKTLDGKVYIPSFGINTIGNLKPGAGYKVYVTNSDTLLYPGN